MRTNTLLLPFALLVLGLAACQPAPNTPSEEIAPPGDMAPPGATSAESESAAAPTSAETAPGDTALAAADELVASVNGEPILLADFQRQAFATQRYFVEQGLDPNTEEGQRRLLALRQQVLEDMINQKLIEQADSELGIVVTDADVQFSLQAQIDEKGGEAAFEESLAQVGTTFEEAMAMERSALIGQQVLQKIAGDIPESAEFVHARHILCETEDACQAALTRLEAGETFEAVASSVSVDTLSAERGGDLDWVSRGMLPSQQVEDAIFAIEPGQRSAVVMTDFGYHVIEVIERDPNHPITEEQRYQLQEKRLLDWLADRRAKADVVIYVDDLKTPAGP